MNDQVNVLIMEPLVDILMSTPPESGISKVSELTLSTIFSRHDSHRTRMYFATMALDVLYTVLHHNFCIISFFQLFHFLSLLNIDFFLVVLLEREGFLPYIAQIIWNMASRSLDDLRSNTMLVAHCLGAMRTVAGLIISDTAPERYNSLLYNVM